MSGMLGWYKPHDTEFLTFWFQCDKWGWDDDWGSKFTIEFQVSNTCEIATGNMLKRERVPFMLSTEDLNIMIEKNNTIILNMPGYINTKQTYVEVEGEKVLILGKEVNKDMNNIGQDHWFEYYNYSDIDFWASFFILRLSHFKETVLKS
jgi:hypothetical protein